ncbi:uncharacterized protein LOC134476057 [Cavia porcellus]|uniref:uncharacterized protein LOC134476057 n=1 Tax=Cavia porcellus TaxID=10141 RepID=UPI002FE2C81E
MGSSFCTEILSVPVVAPGLDFQLASLSLVRSWVCRVYLPLLRTPRTTPFLDFKRGISENLRSCCYLSAMFFWTTETLAPHYPKPLGLQNQWPSSACSELCSSRQVGPQGHCAPTSPLEAPQLSNRSRDVEADVDTSNTPLQFTAPGSLEGPKQSGLWAECTDHSPQAAGPPEPAMLHCLPRHPQSSRHTGRLMQAPQIRPAPPLHTDG